MKALLIGVFNNSEKLNVLTNFGKNIKKEYLDEFENVSKIVGYLKFCKTRLFYKLDEEYSIVCFVGLGEIDASFSKKDDIYLNLENIRKSIATGIDSILKVSNKIKTIVVDDCGQPFVVGETISLYSFSYKDYLDLKKKDDCEDVLFCLDNNLSEKEKSLFNKGKMIADLQNISRLLSDSPSNFLTPSKFAEFAKDVAIANNIEIFIHEKKWAEEKKMGCFLAVDQGSDQDCKFVELHFKNGKQNEKPIIFVGKGITFDTGGLSLKKARGMSSQRADMSGGACVLSTIIGISKLNLKGNFIGLIPLCENMPSGKSVKPGDVVYAMNGKSVQINNTDAEGRLVLADALCYADTFDPKLVIDIATLTGAAKTALGETASAVYSTNDDLFNKLRKSGQLTSDRVWQMPLFSDFIKKITNSVLADVVNQSKDTSFGGSANVAAAFLSQFIKCEDWMHIDMAPVKLADISLPYMSKGMSGRPVRTLINFIESLSTDLVY